ncbi:hypothetical protein KOW79_020462 [Hemibagrus wyckioides]|uniref:Uncharacterized protein n=1 Tax=Hemibagrus wyckioides TaxID=337641 RepID=A0A9D3N2Z3_9TELE|nr:hypothetical protein KOW79_020462 [Hemibagrus wyckioides]
MRCTASCSHGLDNWIQDVKSQECRLFLFSCAEGGFKISLGCMICASCLAEAFSPRWKSARFRCPGSCIILGGSLQCFKNS